jgi:CDP-diacylglycerol--inositol 3-phosphatidyltransferase
MSLLNIWDLSNYYANIICYIRLALTFLASLLFPRHSYLASFIIFTSVLLDYFDGPIARKYNQCSNLGAILDWISDIGNILIVAMWWANYLPQWTPLFYIMVMMYVVMCPI